MTVMRTSAARRPSPWLGAWVSLAGIAFWFATTSLVPVFQPHQLPSPGEVLGTARELVDDGSLARHVVASLGRVLAGFAAGATAAVVLGSLVGLSRTAEAMLAPTLQTVRNVPSLARPRARAPASPAAGGAARHRRCVRGDLGPGRRRTGV
jgi:sulfonate transport system permease protein